MCMLIKSELQEYAIINILDLVTNREFICIVKELCFDNLKYYYKRSWYQIEKKI